MIPRVLHRKLYGHPALLVGFGGLTLLSICLSVALLDPLPILLPVAILFGAFLVFRFELVYLLMFALLPLSTEFDVSGGLATDLPSEQFMWIIFALGGLFFFSRIHRWDFRFVLHPASLLLILSFGWMVVTAVFAEYPVNGFKYALAKSWYVAAFYFFGAYFLRKRKLFDRWIWFVTIPLFTTVLITSARHAGFGFTFDTINEVLNPFYRNHVIYSCILATFFPFLWYAMRVHHRRRRIRLFFLALMFITVVAVYFSYTRAAMVALAGAAVWYLVVRWGLVKWAIALAIAGALGLSAFFLQNNRFLEYAPEYERTITHYNFDDLISATYKLEDISVMERFYRWIAGYYMIRERPLTGYGPANFYPVYHSYTITPFKTYVSHNPEKSGIHNYYLMLLVEQGFPGLLLFLALSFYILLLSQKLYRRMRGSPEGYLVMACSLCIFIVMTFSLMNDVIETDKVGPFFFVSSALIVWYAVRERIL